MVIPNRDRKESKDLEREPLSSKMVYLMVGLLNVRSQSC